MQEDEDVNDQTHKKKLPLACLLVNTSEEDEQTKNGFRSALIKAGFQIIEQNQDDNNDGNDRMASSFQQPVYKYKWNPAVGKLQLIQPASLPSLSSSFVPPPRFIPVVQEQENVLVANGWSFLDVDESELLSPFDVDAANLEGQYQPKWGTKFELV